MSEHTSSEEHLGLSDSVQIRVDLQVVDHHPNRLFAVDEVLRDHVRAQNLVSVTELLEWDSAKRRILSMTVSIAEMSCGTFRRFQSRIREFLFFKIKKNVSRYDSSVERVLRLLA